MTFRKITSWRRVLLCGVVAGTACIGNVRASLGSDRTPDALKGRFAFSTRDGDIWVVDANGDHLGRLTTSGEGFDYKPTWSPDGRWIAFQTTRGSRPVGGGTNVFVVASDGTREHQLTKAPVYDYGGDAPDWSPDGRWIAMGSGHGLVLISADGRRAKLLGVQGDGPSWAPDHGRLAFIAPAGSASKGQDIYLARLDGSKPRQLTNLPGLEFPGPWSPDGHVLSYYAPSADGGGHTFTITVNGTRRTQLTRAPGLQAPVVWFPDGRLLIAVTPRGRNEIGWYLVRQDSAPGQRVAVLDRAITADWHP
jgi:Tol biopolymer transport system component